MGELDGKFTYERFQELGIANAVADLVLIGEIVQRCGSDLKDFLANLIEGIEIDRKEAEEYEKDTKMTDPLIEYAKRYGLTETQVMEALNQYCLEEAKAAIDSYVKRLTTPYPNPTPGPI